MITILSAGQNDVENIKALLKQNNLQMDLLLDRLENTMVVKDGQKVVGLSSYLLVEDIAYIDILIIDETFRNMKFGDGLLKATLNLIDKRGVARACLFADKATEGFFKSVGMKTVCKSVYIDHSCYPRYFKDQDVFFEALLPQFFETACRSKK